MLRTPRGLFIQLEWLSGGFFFRVEEANEIAVFEECVKSEINGLFCRVVKHWDIRFFFRVCRSDVEQEKVNIWEDCVAKLFTRAM